MASSRIFFVSLAFLYSSWLAAAQPSAPTPPQQDVTPSPQEVKKVTPGAPFKPSQVLHVDVDLALVNTVGVMRGPDLSCHSSGTG